MLMEFETVATSPAKEFAALVTLLCVALDAVAAAKLCSPDVMSRKIGRQVPTANMLRKMSVKICMMKVKLDLNDRR